MQRVAAILVTCLAFPAIGLAQSNIDNTVPNKYAWGENVGWINWRDVCSGDQPPTNGAIDMNDVAPFVTCLLN